MDESIEEFGVHFTICKVCTCDWRRLLNRRDKLLVIIRMHRIPSYSYIEKKFFNFVFYRVFVLLFIYKH